MTLSTQIPTIKTFSKSIALVLGLTMIAALVACGGGSSSTTTNTTPTIAISATSGGGQSATVSAPFGASLVATVTSNGSTASGVTVTFTAPSSGASGTFASNGTATETQTTNSTGVATSSAFTANATAGNYAVTAAATGAATSASFSLTNNAVSAPVVAITTTSGTPQTVIVGTPFVALEATVTTNGTPTAGVVVTFTAPTTGASGTFASNSTNTENQTTNSTGIATSSIFTANSTAGTYSVTASAPGATTQASFSLTNAAAPVGVVIVATSGTPQSATVSTAFGAPLVATVTNNGVADPGVSVTFTAPSSSASGTFHNGTDTETDITNASGVATSTTFTANATAGGPYNVVASATGATSVDFSLTNKAPITVTLAGVPATLPTSATATFSATTNDTAGVTWTCAPSGTCGSFSPTSTLTTVDTTYTAPSAIPTGSKVTVVATSVTNPAVSASAKITITPATLANGNYVFYLGGTNSIAGTVSGYFVAGQFTVSGGAITGGEEDYVDSSIDDHDLINTTGNTLKITTDGNLQIKLTTCDGTTCSSTDPNVGVSGVETFNVSMASPTSGRIIEFDTSAVSTGTLDLQSSTAAPSAGYAFAVNGVNSSATSALAIGGVINIDGSGTISGTGSVFDINNAGVVGTAQTFAASTVGTPDTSGRVLFTLNPSVASNVPEVALAGYIVDATHIRLVETTDKLDATLGGTAFGQGTNTGQLGTAFTTGSGYVVGLAGGDVNGVLQTAGVLTAASVTAIGGTISYNDLMRTASANPVTGGTYTVGTTGRVAITGLTDGVVTFNINLYLDGNGNAASIDLDTTDVLGGVGYQQTGTFTAGSFSGTYALNAGGVNNNTNKNAFGSVGLVTADGVSALNAGFADLNYFKTGTAATQSTDLTVTGAFTSATDGVFTGTITGLDVTTKTNSDAFTYYLIDSTRVFAIETDANQLTLGYFELAQ